MLLHSISGVSFCSGKGGRKVVQAYRRCAVHASIGSGYDGRMDRNRETSHVDSTALVAH